MINRGVSKKSQYFFNAKTGMLEKVEDNIQTIESLSKKVDSVDKITKEVNKASKPGDPINNITVITADDNLIHNYFTSMEVSWDSSNCLSTAVIKMPKMNTENTNYWTTYTGQLTIYAGYNFTFDYANQNSHPTEEDAAESLTKYWDNSDIKPFFRGEISRVKELGTDIAIYVNSIGIRFQQKIPDDFRESYIYNQNVRDAFQAICEFLGVKHICPPKTASEEGDSATEDAQAETDGTENDVGKQQNKTQTMQKQVQQKVQSASSSNNNTTNQNTDPNDPNAKENEDGTASEEELTNNEEIDTPQNGYGDINFDANGAITHGSKVIETSPDMAETLVAMEENPLEKYLEDETGIVESVKKLLDGEMFDEVHNSVMDYNAITIEAKAASSSEMSTVSSTTPGSTTGTSGEGGSSDGSGSGEGGGESSGEGNYIQLNSAVPTPRAIAAHRAAPRNPWDYISNMIWHRW